MDKSTKIIIVIAWIVGYFSAESQANAEFPMCSIAKSFLYYAICPQADRMAYRNGVWIGLFVLIFLILITVRWFYRSAKEGTREQKEKDKLIIEKVKRKAEENKIDKEKKEKDKPILEESERKAEENRIDKEKKEKDKLILEESERKEYERLKLKFEEKK
jgi:hypothetical protein